MTNLTEQTLLHLLNQQTITNMLLITQLSVNTGIITEKTLGEKLQIATDSAAEALKFVVERTAEICTK